MSEALAPLAVMTLLLSALLQHPVLWWYYAVLLVSLWTASFAQRMLGLLLYNSCCGCLASLLHAGHRLHALPSAYLEACYVLSLVAMLQSTLNLLACGLQARAWGGCPGAELAQTLLQC